MVSGLTDYSDEVYRNSLSDVDFMPYTTLTYANGPGYVKHLPRKNLSDADISMTQYTFIFYKNEKTNSTKIIIKKEDVG